MSSALAAGPRKSVEEALLHARFRPLNQVLIRGNIYANWLLPLISTNRTNTSSSLERNNTSPTSASQSVIEPYHTSRLLHLTTKISNLHRQYSVPNTRHTQKDLTFATLDAMEIHYRVLYDSGIITATRTVEVLTQIEACAEHNRIMNRHNVSWITDRIFTECVTLREYREWMRLWQVSLMYRDETVPPMPLLRKGDWYEFVGEDMLIEGDDDDDYDDDDDDDDDDEEEEDEEEEQI